MVAPAPTPDQKALARSTAEVLREFAAVGRFAREYMATFKDILDGLAPVLPLADNQTIEHRNAAVAKAEVCCRDFLAAVQRLERMVQQWRRSAT
jgi:hypothetical protein